MVDGSSGIRALQVIECTNMQNYYSELCIILLMQSHVNVLVRW